MGAEILISGSDSKIVNTVVDGLKKELNEHEVEVCEELRKSVVRFDSSDLEMAKLVITIVGSIAPTVIGLIISHLFKRKEESPNIEINIKVNNTTYNFPADNEKLLKDFEEE